MAIRQINPYYNSQKYNIMCRIILKQTTSDLFSHPQKQNQHSATNTVKSVRGGIKSSSSRRSKYISNSRLTKNGLFSAINGRKTKDEQQYMEQLNFEASLLSDTYQLLQQNESSLLSQIRNGLRTCREECKKVMRGLQHYDP